MTSQPDAAFLPTKTPAEDSASRARSLGLPFGDDALPEDIPALEAQMDVLTQAISDCEQQLRRLIASEKPEQGITFAQEIHAARQQKLALGVSKELRRVRINRIRANVKTGTSFLL